MISYYYVSIRLSNTPYPDAKRGFYYQNDAFKQILKSYFDFKQQQKWKIVMFFHSLLFLT